MGTGRGPRGPFLPSSLGAWALARAQVAMVTITDVNLVFILFFSSCREYGGYPDSRDLTGLPGKSCSFFSRIVIARCEACPEDPRNAGRG